MRAHSSGAASKQWLPQGWKEIRNNLSAGSLDGACVRSSSASSRAHASERKPRVERLNEVLAGLGNQRRATNGTVGCASSDGCASCWNGADREDRDDWFDRMVPRVGIVRCHRRSGPHISLGAMVVLALVVVLNELRAARACSGAVRATATADERDAGPRDARPIPTMGEIERAPLVERPRMLLELIAAKLTAPRGACRSGKRDDRARAVESRESGDRAGSRTARHARAHRGARALRARVAFRPTRSNPPTRSGRELLDSVEKLREPEVPARS